MTALASVLSTDDQLTSNVSEGEFVSFPNSAFQLLQPFAPAGDQPAAIEKLVEGISDGLSFQTLLGVTGSGKTFTMASVIARLGRPAIVFAPNKTLAAQLYGEFRDFFPKNAVEYFVSYYDYYQPEAYVPQRDLFIEKKSRNSPYNCAAKVLLGAKTIAGRPKRAITLAMVKVLPEPVTPNKVWKLNPSLMPSTNFSMAAG